MEPLGTFLRWLAWACFAIFVFMQIVPPPQDALNLAGVAAPLFWVFFGAATFIRRSDDLPLATCGLIISFALVFWGKVSGFGTLTIIFMLLSVICLLYRAVASEDKITKKQYALGYLIGIALLLAKYVYDIYYQYPISETHTTVLFWTFTETHSPLEESSQFLFTYSIFALGSATLIYLSDRFIDDIRQYIAAKD